MTETRNAVLDALRERGVRPTPQRVTVAAELMREADDVTAQELHARLRARGEGAKVPDLAARGPTVAQFWPRLA